MSDELAPDSLALTDTPASSSEAGDADLTSLRLQQDFAAEAGVRKRILRVPVSKPNKQAFIRVHPGEEFAMNFALVELQQEREVYIVRPDLVPQLENEIIRKRLFTAIDRQGNVFLWPIRTQGSGGHQLDSWNQSALDAAQQAMTTWVRVVSNQALGAYDVVTPQGTVSDPTWPKESFKELLGKAFKGKVIESIDHPVLRHLRGEG